MSNGVCGGFSAEATECNGLSSDDTRRKAGPEGICISIQALAGGHHSGGGHQRSRISNRNSKYVVATEREAFASNNSSIREVGEGHSDDGFSSRPEVLVLQVHCGVPVSMFGKVEFEELTSINPTYALESTSHVVRGH